MRVAIATIVGGDGLGRRVLISPDGRVVTGVDSPALASRIAELALGALGHERSQAVTIADTELIIEIVMPPRPLIVFGSNYDVLPLVEQAKCVGWDVTIAVRRETATLRQRLSIADRIVVWPANDLEISRRSAVVVMTHNYEADRAALKLVLPTAAPYVGILGPRARTERLLADVAGSGVRVATMNHRNTSFPRETARDRPPFV